MGTPAGTVISQIPAMPRSWDLRLAIDARDSDACRVRARPASDGHAAIAVRTGPVTVYCLDGSAVTSIAAAWALAYANSAHLLPVAATARRHDGPPQHGVAAPVGDVAVEGHQRWDVVAPRPGQPFAVVASEWLSVRVHDVPALETYARAWATACALGARILQTAPLPFDRLVGNAHDVELAHRYAEHHPSTSRDMTRAR